MVLGIIIVAMFLLIFAYIVYVNEKRKRKAEGSPKKRVKEPKEPKFKKEKKYKEPKTPKEKRKNKEREDTDLQPNFDALVLGGQEDNSINLDIGLSKENQSFETDFMKQQLNNLFGQSNYNDNSNPFSLYNQSQPNVEEKKPDKRTDKPAIRTIKKTEQELRQGEYASDLKQDWRYSNDMVSNESESEMSGMLNDLPPELKTILLTNILDRKDDWD